MQGGGVLAVWHTRAEKHDRVRLAVSRISFLVVSKDVGLRKGNNLEDPLRKRE